MKEPAFLLCTLCSSKGTCSWNLFLWKQRIISYVTFGVMLLSVLNSWGTILKHLSRWKISMQKIYTEQIIRRNDPALSIDWKKHIYCKPSICMKLRRKQKNSQRHQRVAAYRWFTRFLVLEFPFCQTACEKTVCCCHFKVVGSGSNHELYVMEAFELFGLLSNFSHCFSLFSLFSQRSLFDKTPLVLKESILVRKIWETESRYVLDFLFCCRVVLVLAVLW